MALAAVLGDGAAMRVNPLAGFPSNRGDFVIRILFLLPVLP
jgi:hypothetical protein